MGLFDIFKRKKKHELTEDQLKLNKMWDLWVQNKAESPYKELMDYQSEINNGGHSQFFTNVESRGELQKEMSALDVILPSELKSNLHKAYKAFLISEEKDGDDESDEILERCDDIFWDKEEEINRILNDYASKITL